MTRRRRIGIFLLPAALRCAAFAPPPRRRPFPAARVGGPRTNADAGLLRVSLPSHSDSDPRDGGGCDALETIRSWLLARLPDLPAAELELYSSCLLNDGYSTPAQLDGINSGASGRVEDLYFMRKGHRLSLMKRIGSGGGGGNNGRGGGAGAAGRFASTEVDGEFAIVEEFLNDPRPLAVEEKTNPDLLIEEDIIYLQTNSGATLAGRTAVDETEAKAPPTFEGAEIDASRSDSDAKKAAVERSLSEDERCARPAPSSRSERKVVPDHRCPGDTRRAHSDGASRRSAVSLSGGERCERPVASSGRDRCAELGAVACRLGDTNITKRTDRSPPEPVAASLSRGEARMRPAPSGGASDGRVPVDDRTGDARVASRRTRTRGPDGGVLGRGTESRNESPEPVSADPLSRGEARARPALGGGGSSGGRFTVEDRTGDARVTRRTRVDKPKDEVLDRAADSTRRVRRRRLLADDSEKAALALATEREARVRPAPSGNGSSQGHFAVNDRTGDARATRRTRVNRPKVKVLDRAADSTHKVRRRSLPANDFEIAAPTLATERHVPPNSPSGATLTHPPSVLAGLTKAAPSNAKNAARNGPTEETEGVPLLQSLAGERPRGGRGRRDEGPIHLRTAFEPSSLRSLLKN